MATSAPTKGEAAKVNWLGTALARLGRSRTVPVVLAVAALISGVITYAAFSGTGPQGPSPQTVLVLLNVDLAIVLLLSAVVARRLVQLWLERRRGSAGSRLHVRLVALFSVVAVAPAIIVAVFSVLFLNLGIEQWFSSRVGTAVEESLAVAEAYLAEHRKVIRADALAMANDVNRAWPALRDNPARFDVFLATQAALRSLTEATVFRRDGRVLARAGLTFALSFEPPPIEALQRADDGEVVIETSDGGSRVNALVRLNTLIDSYLYVGRFVDSRAISHMERTQSAVSEYQALKGRRSGIQITFALIFGVVTLLLLLAAVWVGLTFATELAGPISHLVAAAERVRSGDLSVRVDEREGDDEIATLSRAFNRMTDQLESQRRELIEANRQLDARRRFTESVLSGVSAGVIGLDARGRIELPNRSALELLEAEAGALVGRPLADAVPEMAALMTEALQRPGRRAEGQVTIARDGRTRTLFVRISAERLGGALEGFVVTFDDISELVAAQRAAAWADVARRIAHEIKNPLTPIQLSAERLKRRYLKEIKNDPETFVMCTDTIVRQVGDIGRMIDEFSGFARMPAPRFALEDLTALARQAIELEAVASPDITFVREFPDSPVMIRCDGHQIGQVLTNLLRNAVESIAGRTPPPDGGPLPPGEVRVRVAHEDGRVVLEVLDNGSGLPREQRERLLEPYVTTRTKGTGLGLAIVKKIVEDHQAELVLADREGGGACVRVVFAAAEAANDAGEKVASSGP